MIPPMNGYNTVCFTIQLLAHEPLLAIIVFLKQDKQVRVSYNGFQGGLGVLFRFFKLIGLFGMRSAEDLDQVVNNLVVVPAELFRKTRTFLFKFKDL